MSAYERPGAPLPPAARERVAARARKVALIRRSIVAAALATFALAWGVIAWHGYMGPPDAKPAAGASGSGSTSASTAVSPSVQDSGSDDGTTLQDAPVTTSQS